MYGIRVRRPQGSTGERLKEEEGGVGHARMHGFPVRLLRAGYPREWHAPMAPRLTTEPASPGVLAVGLVVAPLGHRAVRV